MWCGAIVRAPAPLHTAKDTKKAGTHRTSAPVEPKSYSGSRITICSCSKMAGGRGGIGEIFRAPGLFGPLASSIRYMNCREFLFYATW
jgi:hypothetical protein